VAVVWEGAQRALHSLALVNRSLCSELIARGHEVSLVPSEQPGVAEDLTLPAALDERLFRSLARPTDIHIRHQWPPQLVPPAEGRWVIMQPWEFGSPPKSWVAAMNDAVDEVWVPSRFVRDGFVSGGIPADRVYVIPNGVDCDRFHPSAPPLPLKTQKRFTFLFVGGTIHRKGIDILLDAFTRAFTAADDVCLVIKDMGVGSFYRGQTAEDRIAEIRGRADAPEIEYLTDKLADADLAGLYTACDCLVHPYRGEGFGLPIAEAMACGLPVIVTNHGAALDFCDTVNAYLVPARPVYLADNRVGDLETVGRPWLTEPDRDLLIELMQHAVKNEDERRWKGRHGRQRIVSQFTWKHAADTVEARFAALMAKPPRRRAVPAGAAVARPTVSLCMIVKNEEDNLAACLGPVADLVDEMIVVDTGSADRTKEIAAQLGARVFDFPWVDSFAAARNESLRHASGDWIFWMDADDRVVADNREKLRAVFANLSDENIAHVMKCACVPQERGGTTTVVDHVRLFRNRPDLRWEYRVHEQILPALRRTGVEVRWSDVVIQHVGYQDPALRGRKLERDIRLLRLEDAERPDDPFTLFNLGSVYQELGRVAEAVPLFKRSLERSHPTDSIVRKLYALLSQSHRYLGEKELALAAALKGREFYPNDVELLFHEGLSRRELHDNAGAEAGWLKLLESRTSEHFASVDAGIAGYKARHNLAVLYQETGRHAEAEKQWRLALAEQPTFLPAKVGLGDVMIAQERWTELQSLARDVEGMDRVAAVSLRVRAYLARKEFAEARQVCEQAIVAEPRAIAPRRFLSHALLQEGRDWAAAEQALRAVLDLDPNDVEARNNLAVLLQQKS
jgi:glycosyltransferase involved in cell wall biosynthesis